jgi:organic anion transporter 3A
MYFLCQYCELLRLPLVSNIWGVFAGGIAVPGAVFGILVGGYLVRRFQLTKKGDYPVRLLFACFHVQTAGAAQLTLALNVVALTGYGLFFILGCENLQMAGATVPYHNRYELLHMNISMSQYCVFSPAL